MMSEYIVSMLAVTETSVCRVVGVRVGTVLFTCFLLAGQLILSLGSYLTSVEVMDLGRYRSEDDLSFSSYTLQ